MFQIYQRAISYNETRMYGVSVVDYIIVAFHRMIVYPHDAELLPNVRCANPMNSMEGHPMYWYHSLCLMITSRFELYKRETTFFIFESMRDTKGSQHGETLLFVDTKENFRRDDR